MTPEQLKTSIFQCAIQGKLVEQRLEEGSAVMVYERIQEDKKQTKAKKGKKLPEIVDDELPFEIPDVWKWVRIGDVCNIINGFTPKRSNAEYWTNGTIPWFTIEDVRRQGRFIESTEQFITEKALSKDSERIVPAETVLLCCTASVGEYAYAKIPLTTNQQFNALVIREEYKEFISSMYIYQFVQTLKGQLISNAGKTTLNFLSVGKLSEMLIPVPPLEEQHRIVSKIEELRPYVDRYAEAYEKLEKFNAKFPENMKRSILQYAIQGKLVEQRLEEGTAEELYLQIQEEKQKLLNEGKVKREKKLEDISDFDIPFDIPDTWKWIKVGELSSKVTDGEHKTPHRVKEFCGYYLLSARNVLNGSIRLDDVDYVDEEEYKRISKRCNPQEGDILLSCSGSVGRCTCVRDKNKYVMVRSAAMISPIMIDSKYLMYAIQSDCVQMQIREKTKQTAQANLFQAAIINLVIPVPPVNEQRRIVNKIEELLPFCEKL